MTTRRTFLASVTTAGAGLAIGAPRAAADPGVGAGQPSADLPPAIRALRPMTAGVVPCCAEGPRGGGESLFGTYP